MMRIGGSRERIESLDEQVVRDAREALAALQRAKTDAEQLVIDLRTQLAEVDDVETFTHNINTYRQKQQELEALLTEVAEERAEIEAMKAVVEKAAQDVKSASETIAQKEEAIAYGADAIIQWRQELGNANNVYTGLEMVVGDRDATFDEVLEAMASPSVGYFAVSFDGDAPGSFIETLLPDREFLGDRRYFLQVTVNKFVDGYHAEVRWGAEDGNGVFAPMTYEDRTVLGEGDFDTGWQVRAYQPNQMVYGG